jgi:signal peptidase I
MPKNPILKAVLEFIKTVAIVLILAFIIKAFLIQTFIIDGTSMEPNFHNNEYLLVDKLSYHFTQPKRGDVDILIPPDDVTKDYIKRIIGVPGDTVTIKSGQVFINKKLIKEPYLPKGTQTLINDNPDDEMTVKLKKDQYFVLGDNRGNSRDSRFIGVIPKHNIIGKTLLIVFPIKNFELVNHFN